MFALIWTVLMTVAPRYFDVPMAALSAAALALFVAKTPKTLLLYPQKVRSGIFGAVIASIAGLSLTHTVGKAVISRAAFTSGQAVPAHAQMRRPGAAEQVSAHRSGRKRRCCRCAVLR